MFMKRKFKVFFKEITNRDFLISISCLMLMQSLIFTFIKYLQIDYHVMASRVDDFIPFLPYIVYIYNIFYPFVFIVLYYVFLHDKKSYYHGIIAGTIGYLLCDIIFLIYPTIMIRPDVMYDKLDIITGFIVKLTYLVDTPAINCFPSIHCLFCFQAAYTTIVSKGIGKKEKAIITFILLLISASTVLMKQHYFYDILGAFAVFAFSNIITFLIFKFIKKK